MWGEAAAASAHVRRPGDAHARAVVLCQLSGDKLEPENVGWSCNYTQPTSAGARRGLERRSLQCLRRRCMGEVGHVESVPKVTGLVVVHEVGEHGGREGDGLTMQVCILHAPGRGREQRCRQGIPSRGVVGSACEREILRRAVSTCIAAEAGWHRRRSRYPRFRGQRASASHALETASSKH